MNNLHSENMSLNVCIECHEDIQIDQKMVLIHEDGMRKYWVHDGNCYSKYLKLLTDPEETILGTIIGICEYCDMPVRRDDEFKVLRTIYSLLESIVPKKSDIYFAHKGCHDRNTTRQEGSVDNQINKHTNNVCACKK